MRLREGGVSDAGGSEGEKLRQSDMRKNERKKKKPAKVNRDKARGIMKTTDRFYK